MKTKIATTFGLALMLALGIFGTMLALGLFSPLTARADVDITSVTVTPTTPGAASTISLTFNTNTIVQQGQTITVTFDKAFGVPATISKDAIVITTSQTTGGSSNPTIDPAINICEANTTDGCSGSGDIQVHLTLGDTVAGTAGIQNLFPAVGHIIQFSPLAGITNPTSASATGHDVWITTTNEPNEIASYTDQDVTITRVLTLSSTSGAIGSSVTLTGRAFSGTGSVTVWIDDGDGTGGLPGDGTINGTETILVSGVSVSSGRFDAVFTVDSNFTVGGNRINAVDGTGAPAGSVGSGAACTIGDCPADVLYTLRGRVSLDKSTVARGETIQIQLREYTNAAVARIRFGGVDADLSGFSAAQLLVTNNTLDLSVTVPTTTPLGTQEVRVTGPDETRTTSVEITGVPTTVSPVTAVANQEITVSASGFTGGATVTAITVSGINVPTLSSGSNVTTVTMDNSGNMIATFRVPNDETTRTAGSQRLRILGSGLRLGEVDVTTPARELVLATAESRRGSTVSFTGSGYLAEGTVTISYRTLANTVITVTADTAGNIAGSFLVPSSGANAPIPSTNTVTATISCTAGTPAGNICTQVTASSTHKIPGASITVEPGEIQSGNDVVITGAGFPGFVSLATLTIGGVNAMPTPAPATDVDGRFEATILVPQLGAGTATVVVTAGGTSANTPLLLLAAAVTPVVVPPVAVEPSAPEAAFEELITAEILVRVWRFDASTQTEGPDFGWTLFDPRDIAAVQAANTFTSVEDGMFMWIGVSEQTTATLGGVETTFFPDWTPVTWGR